MAPSTGALEQFEFVGAHGVRVCDWTRQTGDSCGQTAIVELVADQPATGYSCAECLGAFVAWAAENTESVTVRRLPPVPAPAPAPADTTYARAVAHSAFFPADASAALVAVAAGHTLGWSADPEAAVCTCGWSLATAGDVQRAIVQARVHVAHALRSAGVPE